MIVVCAAPVLIFVGRMVKELKVHEGKDYGLNGNGLNN